MSRIGSLVRREEGPNKWFTLLLGVSWVLQVMLLFVTCYEEGNPPVMGQESGIRASVVFALGGWIYERTYRARPWI